MKLRYRFIQLFYTDRNAGIGACNLCIQFGLSRLIKMLESVPTLMVEIQGILILRIIKKKFQ